MAKSQGFVLPFTGRVGRTTTGYRAGRYITRVIPDVKPTGDPTTAQKIQQARFAKLGNLMSVINAALQKGLNHLSRTYAFQQGVKLNAAAVTASNPIDVEVSYADLVVSKGKLPAVSFAAPSFPETNTISVDFVGNMDQEGADSADQVYILAYSPELNQAMLSSPVSRSERTVIMITPLGWNGSTVHVYGFAIRNRSVVSNSAYVGTGTIN